MIARHDGAVVLVSASIPGETVEAVVEKVQRGTVWAKTTHVHEPSPDRIDPQGDWACGGLVFGHIGYARQLTIKRDIIRDALTRIGRMATPDTLSVQGSAMEGYRMRARLHVQNGRIGFFKEGSHVLCDPGPTRQLLPVTVDVLHGLEDTIRALPRAGIVEIEVSENCPANQRAVHFDLAPGADPSRLGSMRLIAGVTGMSCGPSGRHRSLVLSGSPEVEDAVTVAAANGSFVMTLVRHVRSFFQSNRFLLANLVGAVVDAVPAGRVLDLYAGVGLFAAALAVRGGSEVLAIEGDRSSADDLKRNGGLAGGTMTARHQAVETFLATEPTTRADTVIVDPPRTGLSKESLAGVVALEVGADWSTCRVMWRRSRATRACSSTPATGSASLRAFDLFPNTAHVESVGVFER